MVTTPGQWLEHQQYVVLTTFRRNGTAVPTPIWFAIHEGRLYGYSDGEAGKVKRIRATGRVEVAPCTVRGKVTGPAVPGMAVIIDEERGPFVHGLLNAKYTWKKRIFEAGGRALELARLHKSGPEAFFEVQFDDPSN